MYVYIWGLYFLKNLPKRTTVGLTKGWPSAGGPFPQPLEILSSGGKGPGKEPQGNVHQGEKEVSSEGLRPNGPQPSSLGLAREGLFSSSCLGLEVTQREPRAHDPKEGKQEKNLLCLTRSLEPLPKFWVNLLPSPWSWPTEASGCADHPHQMCLLHTPFP